MPATDASAAADVAQAHEVMLRDKTLQFDFTSIKIPEPPSWPWLEPILKAFAGFAPVLMVAFWIVVGLIVLAILYFIAREVVQSRFGSGGPKANLTGQELMDWRPDAAQAKVLLADADALAADGRYAEAAHLLLLRGVQDIRDQRPGLLRPAFTSRDIAALRELSDQARAAFGAIAQVVERSFFGGRNVDADGWRDCRKAYEDFALKGAAA